MTPEQKLEALNAFVDGEWDNPQLVKVGPLSTSFQDNIQAILEYVPKTYNHAYTIAFEIPGSIDFCGGDVTKEQIFQGIDRRLDDLKRNGDEIFEAVGDPYDTFVED